MTAQGGIDPPLPLDLANSRVPQNGFPVLNKVGQGGIRTHGWFNPTHAFQASPIDRSGTCPSIQKDKHKLVLLRADKEGSAILIFIFRLLSVI